MSLSRNLFSISCLVAKLDLSFYVTSSVAIIQSNIVFLEDMITSFYVFCDPRRLYNDESNLDMITRFYI